MEQGFLANIPIVHPSNIDFPWLVAFTAIARSPELSATYKSKLCSDDATAEQRCDYRPAAHSNVIMNELDDRSRLERALEPLQVVWLSLEHGNAVVVIPEMVTPDTLTAGNPSAGNSPEENPHEGNRLGSSFPHGDYLDGNLRPIIPLTLAAVS